MMLLQLPMWSEDFRSFIRFEVLGATMFPLNISSWVEDDEN